MNLASIPIMAGGALLLGGCIPDGSAGAGPHPTAAAPTPAPGTALSSDPLPEPTNPPYQIGAHNDLAIFACHIHQDYYGDPTHFGFWWGVRSTYATAVAGVTWRLERLDGTPQPVLTGTMPSIPANYGGGDGHGMHVEWTEQAPGTRHQYRLSINPDRSLVEAGYDNDSYIFELDVPATSSAPQLNDLAYYGREAHVHAMLPDSQYEFHFAARNQSYSNLPATTWRLQDPLEGIDSTYVLPAFAPGQVNDTHAVVRLLAPGRHVVTMTLDSANRLPETNEANNVRVFYLLVGAPAGSG